MVQHTEIGSRMVVSGDMGRGDVYKVCRFMQDVLEI